MKIALAQVDAGESWSSGTLARCLESAGDVDLVVFPECFPFWNAGKKALSLTEAKAHLRGLSGKAAPPFIAGGYVRERSWLRNAAFLVSGGVVRGTYFKRLFGEEEDGDPGSGLGLKLGTKAVRFEWDGNACIPLICADACGDRKAEMVKEVKALGAGRRVPIVVVSYAGEVRAKDWTDSLKTWSRLARAPVAYCNFAGRVRLASGLYGLGGSGVFWPDGTMTRRPFKPGVYVHDLAAGPPKTGR